MKVGLELFDGHPAGKNPRELSENDFASLGHSKTRILKVIRTKCLDCCGNMPSEVRRCVSTSCALWPYRMGWNPFYGKGADEEAEE